MSISAEAVKELALSCGFELAGITGALPAEDFARFDDWRKGGYAGEMGYLTDHRGDLRADPRGLLPAARSMLCVGKLYNAPDPENYQTNSEPSERGTIARYARADDYHAILREKLEKFIGLLGERHSEPFEYRICVDTAPLLERSYARLAGLGWIGKNSCLINQQLGSWLFLAEVLLSIPLAPDAPAPARCGTCTRCIGACPTRAIVSDGAHGWRLDSRLCISYLTIEKRGELEADLTSALGTHLFGCDICQDVCPWNRRSPETSDPRFQPRAARPLLETLAVMSEDDFRETFRRTPVWRSKYSGFLRNVAFAMGNSGNADLLVPLERLSRHVDTLVASSARHALEQLRKTTS
jgi:epoxyqueuosine reductase